MKIRIKGNSIRLRLTKSEVEAFGKTGYLEERTEFGNHLFMYALRKNPDVHELSAGFVGIKITMHVPTWMADEWVNTNEVGYSNVYTFNNGKQLSLLLEKDFVCLDAAVNEDQSDNFENPLHTCGPLPASTATEQAPATDEQVAAEPVAEHIELVEESLPSHIEDVAEPTFTPVELNDSLSEEEEPSEEQCSVAEELITYREHIADAAHEEPAIAEEPTYEVVEEPTTEADEPVATENYPAVEMPAHEAVTEAIMVADEPAATENYPAVEMPAHEAVTEAIMVADEPAVTEQTSAGAQETPQPHWKSFWDTPVETDEVKQQIFVEEDPAAPVANEAEEQHPLLSPEQEESPAAPGEMPTPPPARTGPVRPPNWR